MRMRTPVSDLVFSIYACVMYGHGKAFSGLSSQAGRVKLRNRIRCKSRWQLRRIQPSTEVLNQTVWDPSEGLLKKEEDYLLG